MSHIRTIQRSFHGGVVSPELYGRIDLSQFQNGLAQADNLVVLPHGAAQRRPGMRRIDTAMAATTGKSRLIPFVFNSEQSFVIELAADGPSTGAYTSAARMFAAGGYVLAQFTLYDATVAYSKGDIVAEGYTAGFAEYVCIAGAPAGSSPTTAPTLWRPLLWSSLTAYSAGDVVRGNSLLGDVYAATTDIAAGGAQPTPPGGSAFMPTPAGGNPSWLHLGTAAHPGAIPPAGTRVAPVAVKSPYASDEIMQVTYTQSGDVLTLCHPNHPPMELRRYGNQFWTLTPITFAPSVSAPSAWTVNIAPGPTPVPAGTTVQNTYTVASVAADGSESLASTSPVTVTNDLTFPGAFNRVTINGPLPTGAVAFDVYKKSNGLWGYIGRTVVMPGSPPVLFDDTNITPDISHQPYTFDNTLGGGAGYYPAAVGYYEQRRWFGGWTLGPQNVIATRPGTESDMGFSTPAKADDRLAFKVAAREGSQIAHIVPVQSVLLMTGSNEFRVTSTDGSAIQATTLTIKPQAYVGANHVTPVVHNAGIVYAAARGGRLRSMSFSWQTQSYASEEVAPVAPHLFNGKQLVDMTYQKAPYPVIWAVSNAGTLVALAYTPEQQIQAWHTHSTLGTIESVCAIPEGDEDGIYVVVDRTGHVAAGYERSVERLANLVAPAAPADDFYVDSGATYTGAPASFVTGLAWLVGKEVSILADGAVVANQVVDAGGNVYLTTPASTVAVGLPMTSTLQTLPFAFSGVGDLGQGRPKNVNRVWLRVSRATGVWAGPDESHLTLYPPRTTEPWGSPPALATGEIELALSPSWSRSGQIVVKQSDPLPLTIVSLTQEVEVGGG